MASAAPDGMITKVQCVTSPRGNVTAASFDAADPQRVPRGCAEDGPEADADLEEGGLPRRLDAVSFCLYGRVAESLLMTPRVLCAEHPSLPTAEVATLYRDFSVAVIHTTHATYCSGSWAITSLKIGSKC